MTYIIEEKNKEMNPGIFNKPTDKWQGPGFWVVHGLEKSITHIKQSEKQKLKMATMAPK